MMNKLLIIISISRFTSALSIIGSSSIVYIILSNRKTKLLRPYHRLMLMMSIFDIIQSLAMLIGAAAIPRESNIYGAKGNQRTCNVQGFFMMLGFTVPFYNSCLHIFYVLTILYGISAHRFAKFEPALHAISILVPLSFAVFFTDGGYMAPRGPACMPRGVLPVFTICTIITLCFLICIMSMVSICWKVISRAMKMREYTNFGKKNSQRRSSQSRVNEDKTQTIIQALLYMSAFMLTYSVPYISSFYTRGTVDIPMPFVIEALIKILYPLQGFWNFVFYIRPGVQKVILSNPDRSRLGAILDVIFKPESTVNAYRKSRVLKRAIIPKLPHPRRRKIIAENGTISPLFHTNDQNPEESSSIRGLNDEPETGDLALAKIRACHQQDGKNRIRSNYTAIDVGEGEEGDMKIIDEEDMPQMNADTVQEIGNESSSNEAIDHDESSVCRTSILPTDLDNKFDSDYAGISTPCGIKTGEVSTSEEDFENQAQIRPQPKARRRVSLVNIGSIFSELDITSFDDYSSSDES